MGSRACGQCHFCRGLECKDPCFLIRTISYPLHPATFCQHSDSWFHKTRPTKNRRNLTLSRAKDIATETGHSEIDVNKEEKTL
ncbi:hypothetical protein M514_25392 [Trichuris suis]|uniref:Uncharacterized protein n=1 Tax=Trichuris suis TaxID=68888 RepID=A0A085MYT8_9BILA|nr:hypothetical protein M514_25392 [Trichuris suis]